MNCLATIAAGIVLSAGTMLAGEKAVMHCFAFSVVDNATPEQWSAFRKATDELPRKINGLKRGWHGPLAAPLNINQVQIAEEEARKSFASSGKAADVKASVTRMQRKHGVCMEFNDMSAFKSYGSDPNHASWVAAYEKVRIAGTTTFQLLGE